MFQTSLVLVREVEERRREGVERKGRERESEEERGGVKKEGKRRGV